MNKERPRQANKRSPIQRLHDRAEVARAYLHGETQASIARRLGVSPQQVSFDLQRVREQWQASAIRDFDAHKAEELAKLDELERECWTAWERSKEELVHSTSEKIDDEISVPGGRRGVRIKVPRTRTRAQMRKEAQVGNSAFVYAIERIIDQRAKILGLHAAVDVNMQATITFGDLWQMAQQDRPEIRVLPPPEVEDGEAG